MRRYNEAPTVKSIFVIPYVSSMYVGSAQLIKHSTLILSTLAFVDKNKTLHPAQSKNMTVIYPMFKCSIPKWIASTP